MGEMGWDVGKIRENVLSFISSKHSVSEFQVVNIIETLRIRIFWKSLCLECD